MSSRRNWDSPNPSLDSECAPPLSFRTGGGGGRWHTRLRVRGVPIPTTGEKAGFRIRIRIRMDPDPHTNCESGSRRAKMTLKIEKRTEFSSFEVLDALF